MMRESEDAREGLQETIVNISKQVKEDTDLKEKLYQSLVEEIAAQKAEMESMKRQAAQRE